MLIDYPSDALDCQEEVGRGLHDRNHEYDVKGPLARNQDPYSYVF